eukprot:gene264-516_t
MAPTQEELSLHWAVNRKHESTFTGGKFIHSSKLNRYYALSDGGVNVLDENSNVIHRIEVEEDGCFCFAVNELDIDNIHIFTSHRSLLLRHWIIKNDKTVVEEASWRSHEQLVTDMSIDATGTLLATSSMDRTVKVWDCEGHFCTHNLKGHGNIVTRAVFHPKKLQLVTVAEDFEIRIWDLNKGKSIASLKNHLATISAIRIFDCPHEDRCLLLSAGRDQVVTIWDLDTHKMIKQLPVFEACEDAIAIAVPHSCDDKVFSEHAGKYVIAIVGDRGTLRVLNPLNGRQILEVASQHALKGAMRKIVSLDDTKEAWPCKFATIGEDLRVLHWQNFQPVNHLMGHNGEILHVQYVPSSSSENRKVVMITNDETPQVVDLDSFRSNTFVGHEQTVLTCDVSYDSKYLATETQQCIAKTVGHTGAVTAVAFCYKVGQPMRLATGSQDKTVKVWPLKQLENHDGKKVVTVNHSEVTRVAHNKDVNFLVLSPNGKLLANAGADKVVKIWSTTTPDLDHVGSLEGHRRGVWSCAFSPVDKIVATASGDATIKLWNLRDYQCLKTFEGHANSVLKVQFLPNGMQLMSAGGDGLLKLWNIRTTDNTASFEEHTDKIWTFDLSKDGKMISGGVDSKFLLWRDASDEMRSDEAAEKAEAAEKDSRIQVLVAAGKHSTACTLALELERPHQLRMLIQENAQSALSSRAEGSEEDAKTTKLLNLAQGVRHLNDDNLRRSLPHVATRLANARTAHFAIAVLRDILVEVPAKRIYQVEGLNSLVQSCLSYLQRYQARTEGLV